MESLRYPPFVHNWVNPVDVEAAALPAHLRTIIAHAELGAPEPPENSIAPLITPGGAYETDISPVLARSLTRMMRARTIALRMYARRNATKRCRRDHLMTPENTYHGKNGDQCRRCRNDSRKKAA